MCIVDSNATKGTIMYKNRKINNALQYIKPGREVIYYIGRSGQYCENMGDRQVMKFAYALYEKGRVTLYQRKIKQAPHQPAIYHYIAKGIKCH